MDGYSPSIGSVQRRSYRGLRRVHYGRSGFTAALQGLRHADLVGGINFDHLRSKGA